MLATKRRAVSMMNSDVLTIIFRNLKSMIKTGKFSTKEKVISFKSMEETKMDLSKLGSILKLIVRSRKKDLENFSRKESKNGLN